VQQSNLDTEAELKPSTQLMGCNRHGKWQGPFDSQCVGGLILTPETAVSRAATASRQAAMHICATVPGSESMSHGRHLYILLKRSSEVICLGTGSVVLVAEPPGSHDDTQQTAR